ncbi:hypothetical protein GOV14_02230 [Candidatus Pacearchaeota archaeon]|nr:hypothetical protein [Candidatus Pacearchaeota archaeon]
MTEEVNFRFYAKWGIKGLQISLILIVLAAGVFLALSLRSYKFKELIDIIIKVPGSSIDIFAILEGLILFVALPIIIAIKIGIILKERKERKQ